MAKRRFKLTVTFVFDADNMVLAKLVAAQGKSIAIAEFTKHRERSEVASIMQELRPDVLYGDVEEVL